MDCAQGGRAFKSAGSDLALYFSSSAFIFCADLEHPSQLEDDLRKFIDARETLLCPATLQILIMI
jgi:hypothetical protein